MSKLKTSANAGECVTFALWRTIPRPSTTTAYATMMMPLSSR